LKKLSTTCDTTSNILHPHRHVLIHILKGRSHNVFSEYFQHPVEKDTKILSYKLISHNKQTFSQNINSSVRALLISAI